MIGVVLSLLAALLFGLAVTIQKYSFGGGKEFSIQVMVRNRAWLLSMLVGIIGLLIYLSALGFSDLSTVQPLLSLYILIPIILGSLMFKEKMEVRKWAMVIVFITGIFLVMF